MTHTVEVDRDAEIASLEAIAQSAAAADAEAEAAAATTAGHDPAAWSKATDFVVEVIAGQVCPAWHLERDDMSQLSGALAEVMDHYWPGGPNGIENWHPMYKLLFVVGTITVTRGFDWQTGRLRPMREDHGERETAGREPRVSDGDDAIGQEHGSASIGGRE